MGEVASWLRRESAKAQLIRSAGYPADEVLCLAGDQNGQLYVSPAVDLAGVPTADTMYVRPHNSSAHVMVARNPSRYPWKANDPITCRWMGNGAGPGMLVTVAPQQRKKQVLYSDGWYYVNGQLQPTVLMLDPNGDPTGGKLRWESLGYPINMPTSPYPDDKSSAISAKLMATGGILWSQNASYAYSRAGGWQRMAHPQRLVTTLTGVTGGIADGFVHDGAFHLAVQYFTGLYDTSGATPNAFTVNIYRYSSPTQYSLVFSDGGVTFSAFEKFLLYDAVSTTPDGSGRIFITGDPNGSNPQQQIDKNFLNYVAAIDGLASMNEVPAMTSLFYYPPKYFQMGREAIQVYQKSSPSLIIAAHYSGLSDDNSHIKYTTDMSGEGGWSSPLIGNENGDLGNDYVDPQRGDFRIAISGTLAIVDRAGWRTVTNVYRGAFLPPPPPPYYYDPFVSLARLDASGAQQEIAWADTMPADTSGDLRPNFGFHAVYSLDGYIYFPIGDSYRNANFYDLDLPPDPGPQLVKTIDPAYAGSFYAKPSIYAWDDAAGRLYNILPPSLARFSDESMSDGSYPIYLSMTEAI